MAEGDSGAARPALQVERFLSISQHEIPEHLRQLLTELCSENERLRQQVAGSRQQDEQALTGDHYHCDQHHCRLLAEISYEAIGFHDNGVLVSANNQFFEMFGYQPEELLGKQVIPLTVAPDDREKLRQQVAGGSTEPYEAMGLRKDGTTFPIEVRAREIELNGRTLRAGVIRDLSERKRLEEERHELEAQVLHARKLESLARLAGGIAHDFNNLLMGVLGNAELATIKLAPLSPVRDNITEIEKAAKRAASLSAQLLAYSGQGKYQVRPIDLTAAVEATLKLLNSSLPRCISLRCELDRQLPKVHADLTQIRQALMWLISNAAEAIGEQQGTITITTRTRECDQAFLRSTYVDDTLPAGCYVCLEVADTGCGMDQETLAKVFEPFYSTKLNGRGLAMAALLGIVRAHQGAVTVESTQGEGTRFLILLPAMEPVPAREGVAGDEQQERFSGTVLLADDEEIVRRVSETMLRRLGFEVLTAADGDEAVELFREHADTISLVLLDSKMPRVNGEDAFPEIRSIRSDAKVILSSGFSEEQTTAKLAGMGLNGFIHKPYSFGTLKEKIREALQEGSE